MIKVLSKIDDEHYDVFDVTLNGSHALDGMLQEVKSMEILPFNYCVEEWCQLPKLAISPGYYLYDDYIKYDEYNVSEETDFVRGIRSTHFYSHPLLRALFDMGSYNKDTDKWGNILSVANCIEELFPQIGYQPFISASCGKFYECEDLVNSCVDSFRKVDFDMIEGISEHIVVKNPKFIIPGFQKMNGKNFKIYGGGKLDVIKYNTVLLMMLTGKEYYYDKEGKVKKIKLK